MNAGSGRLPLVVSFADSSYLPLLRLWLARLQQLNIARVRVFCLDSITYEWCESQRVAASRIRWSGDLRALWVQRIGVFRQLLAAGEEFIHSDIDAIWIKNPLQCGSASGCEQDLIFSQGTVWPPEIHDRWGFVLCCGWFWAKPSSATAAFFAALEPHVRASGDDQISVNRLLAELGAQWSQCKSDYQLPFLDRLVQCWSQPISASTGTGELSVALLPQREFQRLPENSADAIVKHYLTPKNCQQKLAALRAYGLLEIKDAVALRG
jgi:hypothetical protein